MEGLTLCRESVRRIRAALGRPAKHPRRPPRHLRRRLPEARAGSLVLLDGSPADWLEARGPTMTLHGALDDAGGEVLALYFRPTEDLHRDRDSLGRNSTSPSVAAGQLQRSLKGPWLKEPDPG